MRRRCIVQAAQMAGFSSVRLLSRSVAAIQSLWIEKDCDSSSTSLESTISDSDEHNFLFVALTGQATEVAIIRGGPAKLQQLATAGHWSCGKLLWLQRLVDLVSQSFQASHGVNPKQDIKVAARLQVACEQAMNSLLEVHSVPIELQLGDHRRSVQVYRRDWLEHCKDLVESLRDAIERVCAESKIGLDQVDRCVTLGVLLRIPGIADRLFNGLPETATAISVDRADVARGAAVCLAAELPGRSDNALPPRSVTGQSIGIVVEDKKGRRRILPIIPRGTLLPARTNRRLTVNDSREVLNVSLVESSGVDGKDWQSLGRHEIEVGPGGGVKRSRTISFEVNVNGLLTVRAPMPTQGTPSVLTTTRLPPLPTPNLSNEEIADWRRWIETVG
jgi:molecular chaperone DnaK (HSP70)